MDVDAWLYRETVGNAACGIVEGEILACELTLLKGVIVGHNQYKQASIRMVERTETTGDDSRG